MRVVLDIETTSDHSHIWMVCLRNIDNPKETWTFKNASESLSELLQSCDLIAGHNLIAFDRWVLQNCWKIQIPWMKCFDTLTVSRLLNPNLEGGHSLDNWGRIVGVPKFDYSAWDNPDLEKMEEYCLQDTLVTLAVYEEQQKRLNRFKFSDKSVWIEHETQVIVSEQERNGVFIDSQKLFSLNAEITDKYELLSSKLITKYLPKIIQLKTKTKEVPFNPGSRMQIIEQLKANGWEPSEFTEKGNVELNEDILESLVPTLPDAKDFLDYFLLEKRKSQLAQWIKYLDSDGRIHGKVITNGAVTGRATHASPNLGQVVAVDKPYGKEFRSIFTVPEGYSLIGADLSGIELRCLAHYMKDDEYTNEVLNGDVHTKNQLAAGLPTRANAKTFIYAFLYGAGAAKIGSIVGGGSHTGQKLIKKFLSGVPKLKELKETVEKLAAKGSLPGLDGRRVWVRSSHSALNTLLQSAGAIISKAWMIRARENLQRAGIPYKQVLWVHDEIEMEVLNQYAEEVAKILIVSANETQEMLGFRVRVDAEAKIGKTWADVH